MAQGSLTRVAVAGVTPKLGDLVHYVTAEGSIYPAWVIKVHNYATVDVQVMTHEGLSLHEKAVNSPVRLRNSWHWPHQI